MSIAALTAFSGVFALGAIFAIFGSVKLKLQEKLGIDDAKASQLISAMMFSCLVFSIVIGAVTPALGFKVVGLLGFGAGAVCVALLAMAPSYGAAMLAFLALGFAAMCVNTVGNTLGPMVLFPDNPAKASNLMNVFFGLGSLLTPLIIGNLMGKAGYKATLGIIAALLGIPILWTVMGTDFPAIEGGFNFGRAAGFLMHPAVLAASAALFCYISLEATLGGFLTTYLTNHKVDGTKANNLLAGFWACLMFARLFTAFVIPPSVFPFYVPLLALIAAVSIMMMVTAKNAGPAIVAMLVTGFAIGPIFPTIVGVTFGKTGASAEVFGLIFGIGLLGGIFTPRIMGGFSAGGNIRKGMQVLAGLAVLLIVMSAILSYAIPDLVK